MNMDMNAPIRNLKKQSRGSTRGLAVAVGFLLALGSSAFSLAGDAKPAAKTYSVESSISELLANPKAKAVVDKYLPGLSESPQLSLFQSMSLQQLSAFPQADINEEKLKSLSKDLAAIPAN